MVHCKMFRRNFLFGEGGITANVIAISAGDTYRPGAGYGFVIEQNRREQELLKIPELNAGFDTVYWYQNEELTRIKQDIKGCFLEEEPLYAREGRRIPLSFKVDVPRQGNYKVTLTMEPQEDTKDILIFTGRRRLAYMWKELQAGSRLSETFLVNVCDIVPRGKERIYNDKTIDITIVADRPCISGLQIVECSCPAIYIAGDSTVTDQSAEYPYAPGTSYAGWGQMFTAYLDHEIAVSNHSHSGLTTETFRKEGHYAVVDQYSKPRDYFFFQFGHNDQKLEYLKADEGYRSNLIRYITECRDKGAYPVLITPVARNSWKGNDGTYNDLLAGYAESCFKVGELMDVPVIDLHGRSMEFVRSLGLEAVKKYYYPGDFTHSNDYGAYKMAQFVAEEIGRVCTNHPVPGYRILAEHVTAGLGEWIPEETIALPVKPEGYESIENPNGAEELFADLEHPEETLIRADALDMIIKTARFFPTNVYNDMFTDVIGHEWYAGTVECASQNGIILPDMCGDRLFYPEMEVSLEEFLVFAMNGYKSRKRLPENTACRYDSCAQEYARESVRAACLLGVIAPDGSEDIRAKVSRGRAAKICRELHI